MCMYLSHNIVFGSLVGGWGLGPTPGHDTIMMLSSHGDMQPTIIVRSLLPWRWEGVGVGVGGRRAHSLLCMGPSRTVVVCGTNVRFVPCGF